MEIGLLVTPGVVIDGKLVQVGRLLSVDHVRSNTVETGRQAHEHTYGYPDSTGR